MKRMQLFEFEDLPWFPGWLRDCMTRYITAFHRLLGTPPQIAQLVARALRHSAERRVLDLCTGGGGPMLEVAELLSTEHGLQGLQLDLCDLYPNLPEAQRINNIGSSRIRYLTDPVDAANVPASQVGVRTMICSLHHMRPDVARAILRNALESRQPFVAFEISDNSTPRALWWLAIPFAVLTTLLVTPLVRPLSWKQLVFTYAVPLLPIFIAWDGAVSNARTYALSDLDELLSPLRSPDYSWETGTVAGRGGRKVWLMGLPQVQP